MYAKVFTCFLELERERDIDDDVLFGCGLIITMLSWCYVLIVMHKFVVLTFSGNIYMLKVHYLYEVHIMAKNYRKF